MASNEELHDAVTALGAAMRDFGRLNIEQSSSIMARNLGSFLDRQEQTAEQQMRRFEVAVKEAVSAESNALRADFRSVHEALSDLKHEVEALHEGQTRIVERVNVLDQRQTRQWRENADRIAQIDARLHSAEQIVSDHNQSRDASIAERQELRNGLTLLHQEVAALAATLEIIKRSTDIVNTGDADGR